MRSEIDGALTSRSRSRKVVRVRSRAMSPATRPRDDAQPVANETVDRIATGLVTALPVLALFVVAWQLWNSALHWHDVIVFTIMYLLTSLGITVGFHRLFTHRSFK